MQDALYPRCTPPVRHGPTDGRRLTIDNRQWTESSALQSAHGSSGSLLAAASVGPASPRGSAFPGAASADGPARLASASAERHSAFSIRPPLIAAPGKSLTVAPSLRFFPQTRKPTDSPLLNTTRFHTCPLLLLHTSACLSPPIFSRFPFAFCRVTAPQCSSFRPLLSRRPSPLLFWRKPHPSIICPIALYVHNPRGVLGVMRGVICARPSGTVFFLSPPKSHSHGSTGSSLGLTSCADILRLFFDNRDPALGPASAAATN